MNNYKTQVTVQESELNSVRRLNRAILRENAEFEEALSDANRRDHVLTIENQQLTSILDEIDRIMPSMVSQATLSLMRAAGDSE